MMVGRKTGKELKATLEQKSIACGRSSIQIKLSTCRPYSCKIILGVDEGVLDFVPLQTSFPSFISCKVLTKS